MRHRTILLGALGSLVSLCATGRAALYLNDDFSTFANGNLVGQHGWMQLGGVATLPLQVSGGQVVIPGAQSADNQDAWKDNTAGVIPPPAVGTTSVYEGMDLTVQSAPALGVGGITAPSYFSALYNAAGAGGFANERVTAKDNSAIVPGTYLLGCRVTGQAQDPFTYGTTALNYNTLYNVVVQCDMVAGAGNDTMELFVNGSLYLSHPMGAGASDPTGIASLVISQFASASTGNVGATIGGIRLADNFAEASGVPEPASAAVIGLCSCVVLLRRRDARSCQI
jgi:hypothetical protein